MFEETFPSVIQSFSSFTFMSYIETLFLNVSVFIAINVHLYWKTFVHPSPCNSLGSVFLSHFLCGCVPMRAWKYTIWGRWCHYTAQSSASIHGRSNRSRNATLKCILVFSGFQVCIEVCISLYVYIMNTKRAIEHIDFSLGYLIPINHRPSYPLHFFLTANCGPLLLWRSIDFFPKLIRHCWLWFSAGLTD